MTRRSAIDLDGFLTEALAAEAAGEPSCEAVAAVALSVPRLAPPASLRERLLATTAQQHRFDDLEARVAQLMDVSTDVAAGFLRAIDGPAEAWGPGPAPAVSLLHLSGGPAVADAVTGFVRVDVGHEFPEHGHVGDEVVLVLQGSFQDSANGTIYRCGDEATMPRGSSHHFRSLGPARLVGLAIVHGGVVVGGQTIGPADPRA